jgi:hypothetical protein
VTARRRAHACTTGAVASLTTAAIAIPLNPTAALVALAGGILLAACAGSYRTEHRAELARHERARRTAIPFPDPQPMPDWEQLAEQAAYDDAFEQIRRHYDHGTAA